MSDPDGVVHEPVPHSPRNRSTTQRTGFSSPWSVGPEVPGALVRVPVAEHSGPEPEVARQRFEDVLPGPDRIRIPDDDGLTGGQRPHANPG